MYQRSSSRHPSRCALSFEVGNPVNIECPTIELANGADLLDVSVEVEAIVFSDGSKAMSPSSRRGELSWVIACALLGVLATFLLLCHLLSVRTRCACCGRAEAAYSPKQSAAMRCGFHTLLILSPHCTVEYNRM